MDLSEEAKSIVEAGVSAAERSSLDKLAAADKAVLDAVGELSLSNLERGDSAVLAHLIQIAQLHVRDEVEKRRA